MNSREKGKRGERELAGELRRLDDYMEIYREWEAGKH